MKFFVSDTMQYNWYCINVLEMFMIMKDLGNGLTVTLSMLEKEPELTHVPRVNQRLLIYTEGLINQHCMICKLCMLTQQVYARLSTSNCMQSHMPAL